MSITSTAPKRATAEDYNGPKAVRDHGRVATRDIPFMNKVGQVVCFAHLESKNSAAGDEAEQSRPIDSGFDILNDSRAADEVKLLVGELPGPTLDAFQKYPENSFAVSSGGAEITP